MTTLSIIAAIIAVIAITFSIIALVKVIDHEKYIDDIYEWAEDLDSLLDKIIATIGMNKDADIEALARKIEFDEKGNAIIPDELKAKLTPEQLKDVERHLRLAKRIGDSVAKFLHDASEAIAPDNLPSEGQKPAKTQEKGQNKVYSPEFKDEVRKYVAEHADESPYKVAKHFGISKNSVKRWTAKK